LTKTKIMSKDCRCAKSCSDKKTKAEVSYVESYGFVLIKHSKEALCPYQQPIPTQGIGGMGLMRLPCSTLCALANMDEIAQEYTAGCSGITYDVSKENNSIELISL